MHLETAFETSFCIGVVTWWGMQASSRNMVHVLPELIYFCPLGRAARAAQRQQRKSYPESEVITQLPSALCISLIANADQSTLQQCNLCFKCYNPHFSAKKMTHKWSYPNHNRINQYTGACFSLGIPQSVNCKQILAIQTP